MERRNRRKGLSGSNAVTRLAGDTGSEDHSKSPAQLPEVKVSSGKFPKMITLDTLPKAEAPPPMIYRNDYGAVISHGQWEKLQKIKQDAKEGGYEIDSFSQL